MCGRLGILKQYPRGSLTLQAFLSEIKKKKRANFSIRYWESALLVSGSHCVIESVFSVFFEVFRSSGCPAKEREASGAR